MIHLPQITAITIKGYKLYPGDNGEEPTSIRFSDGPWMILGVNGLGKSTLLMMLRYILTGPVALTSPGFKGEKKEPLRKHGDGTFSSRVNDGALDAKATVDFRIGDKEFSLTRNLKNLSFLRASMTYRNKQADFTEENRLKTELVESVGVSHYSDFVKIIDWILFFLDDKTPLIWDNNAQYEIFRSLLVPEISEKMRALEGVIISSDSSIRNIIDVFGKMERRGQKQFKKKQEESETRELLTKAIKEKSDLNEKLEFFVEELENAEDKKLDDETVFKRSELKLEHLQSKYEVIKINEISSKFKNSSKNFQYLLAKTFSDEVCAFCGNDEIKFIDKIKSRTEHGECFFCGSCISDNSKPQESPSDINEVLSDLSVIKEDYYEKKRLLEESNNKVSELRKQVSLMYTEVHSLDKKIRSLTSKLPPEDKAFFEDNNSRLIQLRNEADYFREEKKAAEEEIFGLISELKAKVEEVKDVIVSNFEVRAQRFFAEKIRLVYSPRKTKIGQSKGREILLPTFEVEMTSGATEDEFMRRNPSEVSLSQRDYIDLIFRMALIESLSESGGSLVIDGPEGAVDAVFAKRAGRLISQFSSNKGTNSISACNIVDGDFIPSVLSSFSNIIDRRKRVINLMEIAVPTAASKELSEEYSQKIHDILSVGA